MNKISDTSPDIRYGIFAGIATIIIYASLWLAFPRVAFGLVTYYLSFLIYFVFMYMAVLEQNKKSVEEEYTFRKAARTAFVVYLIANVFYYIFYYLMHQLNPEIAEFQRTDYLENAKHFFPKDELDDQIRALEKADFSVTLGQTISYYVKGVFGAFATSFIIAGLHWLKNRDR